MTFDVVFSGTDEDGLARLTDFLLDRTQTVGTSRWRKRRSPQSVGGQDPAGGDVVQLQESLQEPDEVRVDRSLWVTGYVVLYEIAHASSMRVLAVRHQREEDDH